MEQIDISSGAGFEVVETLEDEYRRRFGASVALIKQQVGPGEVYVNDAAKAIVSRHGAWFECSDLPMEFTGASGVPVRRAFLSDAEAAQLLARLHNLCQAATPDDTRRLGLLALYDRSGVADPRQAYVFDLDTTGDRQASRPTRIGEYRAGTLPIVFRCRIDTDLDVPRIPFQRGALFCMAGVGEKNLLVTMQYTGSELHDLGACPDSGVAQ